MKHKKEAQKDYFRFKEFGLYHGIDTLKVCTESCILGAIASMINPRKILDIGTGSGLIALMLAQRLPGQIDAVEIIEDSYKQAKENFLASPWKTRLFAHHSSISNFALEHTELYDLVVSNPPFYANHAGANKKVDNVTKHETLLNQVDLSNAIEKLITPQGKALVLYPAFEMSQFHHIMKEKGFFPTHSLQIKNFENREVFRVISSFEKEDKPHKKVDFNIYAEPGKYAPEFINIMKDYYLIF